MSPDSPIPSTEQPGFAAEAYPETSPPHDFRMTRQRREVYDFLRQTRDHPTATDIYVRVKERMPGISLATIYNCLETLTHSGMIRQVNMDRMPSRFCSNMADHIHFHCESCGEVSDAEVTEPLDPTTHWQLPSGTRITRVDAALRGLCPRCAAARTETLTR